MGLIGKAGYLAMLVGLVALAVTGVGTFVLGKAPMTHWVLMAHASAAPLFAIGLAVVALTWSDRHHFGRAAACQSACVKTVFWFILASGLVVILSGVVPMTPLFGTQGQHTLYLIHRYAGMLCLAAVGLHVLRWRSLTA